MPATFRRRAHRRRRSCLRWSSIMIFPWILGQLTSTQSWPRPELSALAMLRQDCRHLIVMREPAKGTPRLGGRRYSDRPMRTASATLCRARQAGARPVELEAAAHGRGVGQQECRPEGQLATCCGVKSAAVDRLLRSLADASTLQELRDAARALDRVVMRNHWQVPSLYAANERSSYWARCGMPAQRPRYFTLEDRNSAALAWAVSTWWISPAVAR